MWIKGLIILCGKGWFFVDMLVGFCGDYLVRDVFENKGKAFGFAQEFFG